MRRVTTYCMDMVETKDVLYVLIRADGSGGNIRRINWKDEDLDVFGNFKWPVQMIQDSNGMFYVSDEGDHCVHALIDDGDIPAAKVGTLGTNQVATGAIQDGAVTNVKLANSSISLGGVSIALGATDATPAFNLADATGYTTDLNYALNQAKNYFTSGQVDNWNLTCSLNYLIVIKLRDY